ncbi:MAG: hypothetical protein Q7T74_03990 [Candidatus Saccharibacteria bacterium]|nr:hypothetical protein [Candidatus Saccharibacteria bacterium]
MFIVGLLTWWYSAGWQRFGQLLLEKLVISEDFFSIDILLSTLFAPFKQISANYGSGGTLQMKLQAWFDKLFSRFIGAIIRIVLIFIGALWLLIQVIVDAILMVIWPLIPLLPLIGLGVSFGGYLP